LFGELPKLFDKNFAIAYFLPAAAFVAFSYWILAGFNLTLHLTISSGTFLTDLAAFGSLSLMGGIILMIVNRGVVRLLEGYWPFDLGRRLNWLELWRFRRLLKQSELTGAKLDALEASGKTVPEHLQKQWDKSQKRKANRFPNEERLILPTSFGNTYRAFETYPRVMYGINAIPGWFRLLAVIPKEYREIIDSARARLDFWVNACFLSLLAIVEFYLAAYYAERLTLSMLFSPRGQFPRIPLMALFGFVLAYFFARNAAGDWGNWIKSAFDLYLPDLRARFGFTPAATKKAERETWVNFNIAVLTRNPDWMPAKISEKKDEAPSMDTLSMEVRKLNDQESLLLLEAVVQNKPAKPKK
jgi:hypothetical protein